MNKQQKIKVLHLFEDGIPIKQAIQMEREPKAWLVIEDEGTVRCSDPAYPAEVMPQDIVFHITVLSDEEVKRRFESRNPIKDNGNIAELIN
ncbi:hypothetical protein TBC1_12476 [Lentimicrobium saccharophilum]|uniref:Uncharacterized protein n=1 Tax=Lentimicrobium saccharophilum TaxID=1678841 RepID=A0A0S7C653_9BACT|nr:hypothetical protein [Lentimicrobium saccharophilum]GAP44665.1 hypothetical protein TBC1_12476 [Lentimicrobium saccharophilum]